MTHQQISVIIPAYNIDSHIGYCLDSILSQTCSIFEIIIVNDGSTDSTGEIAQTYAAKDTRVRVIHKENGGVTSARLRGVAEARGEWIGFVDGDDWIEPDMYERLLHNAIQHNADISHCGYQMVFPDGHIDFYHNTGNLLQQDHNTALNDLLCGNFVEPGLWCKLFRRELFDGLAELMPLDIRINEDLLMNYWLFKKAKTSIYEDFCPYHYILRKGSAATASINHHKLWDPLTVAKIILEDSSNEVRPTAYRKYIRMLINGASMDADENPELILPYRTQVRKELREQLASVLKGTECGTGLKTMALWAAISPASYGFIHKIYAKIRGFDKIYDLE